jgi:formylglycine-generating enzyme
LPLPAVAVGRDPLARPVKYELVAGPKGAGIDPETGVLTWDVPKEARTERITIRVRDAEKPDITAEASFTITTTSEPTSRHASSSHPESPPAKPPTPRAASAVKTNARSLPGKAQATRRRGGPDSRSVPESFVNTVGMTLKLIPTGTFMMGSPDSDIDALPDERPQHWVRISKPFYLGVHEVTRSQFRRFVEATGYRTEAEKDGKAGNGRNGDLEQDPKYTWLSPGYAQTDEHPVVVVSWNDAAEFCEWLSRTEGKAYRLPTEAEWEYACRAGTTTKYSSGDDPVSLTAVANVAGMIAAPDVFVNTAPVGQFRANAFGLFDMHGNVWEWCRDGYDARYYRESPTVDPLGPSQTSLRSMRGGSWADDVSSIWHRSAEREGHEPSFRMGHVGFRVALSARRDR